MPRKTISTDGAPAAIGPYVQGVLNEGWLYTSGQIPLDPTTGKLVGGGDGDDAAQTQTRRVLRSLTAVVEAAGGSLADVVKCNVYLADMNHFAAVNAVYAEFFGADAPPARACVEVSRLPKEVLVEIDCVARIRN